MPLNQEPRLSLFPEPDTIPQTSCHYIRRRKRRPSRYATSGVAAENPTYARAGATRRAQGRGPRKENQELEDEAQWPGRRMRGISGSSLGLSERRLPTVAETDYSSGEWESESDRHASSLSPITGSDSESSVLCSLACMFAVVFTTPVSCPFPCSNMACQAEHRPGYGPSNSAGRWDRNISSVEIAE